jgi:uncharacterized protein YkwD
MMIAKMLLCASALMLGEPQPVVQKPQPKTEKPAAKTQKPAAKTKAATEHKVNKPVLADAMTPEKIPDRVVDGQTLAAIEANIVSYTNEERVRFGLEPLKVDKELMESARGHAAWMTRFHSMVHTSQPVAENIAMGQPHSSDVVQCWMNSSGHRANILNPGHRRIGVAAYRTDGGVIFWCQQFQP